MNALICRSNTVWCALPLGHVIETMRPLPVERVGQAAGAVLGAAMIRGQPTPVVDVSHLLGEPRAPRRFITLRVGERSVALAVEEVIGVRDLESVTTLPPLLSDSPVVTQLGALDTHLLVVLQTVRLIEEHA